MAISGAWVTALSMADMPMTASVSGLPTQSAGSHSPARWASEKPVVAPTKSVGVNMPPTAPDPVQQYLARRQALLVILEAAGGVVVDPQGRPFRYNQRDTVVNGDFIAGGDPALVREALA